MSLKSKVLKALKLHKDHLIEEVVELRAAKFPVNIETIDDKRVVIVKIQPSLTRECKDNTSVTLLFTCALLYPAVSPKVRIQTSEHVGEEITSVISATIEQILRERKSQAVISIIVYTTYDKLLEYIGCYASSSSSEID